MPRASRPFQPRYDLLPDALGLMVLQVLVSTGPLHGYGIVTRIDGTSGGALRPDGATFFPAMQRLEQRGFISAKWEVSEQQRRARVYAITASGRRHLAKEKAEWERTAFVMDMLRDQVEQKRELEFAREVQSRLFPQHTPTIAGLEYAGACRPALEVGGDYYDFIPFSETMLGIAIADVSGKGIAASLLMATIRAYLRGQTAVGTPSLSTLMANLNEFIGESSANNRYATCFYGQYDSATRNLTYVNGGHNPPLLFKHGVTSQATRLESGGPAVGLLPGRSYDQGTLCLEKGDLLVAYTDGITEAMNADDLEWGEERLIAAIHANRTLPVKGLVRALADAAHAHVAGAPQHDDMTVVVVRVA